MNKPVAISPSLLEDLVPLRELTPEALQTLALEAEYEDFAARSVIFRKGSRDEFTRYLVSGMLVLAEHAEGGEATLVGMGDAAVATQPLGYEQPHAATAVARTDCRFLRIPTARLNELLESVRLPAYDVAEVQPEQGEAGTRLFYQLFQDLMEDKLALPSMPDVAVRVRQAITERDAGAGEIAKIIQNDPVVAARLMQAANSPLFGGQRPVDSLSAAIVRLGIKNTREVVTAVTMREVFKTRNPLLNKRMVELWMHSSMVAAITAVLARKLPGFTADRALLAGLVHDIGVVPLLAHAGNYEELARDPGLLEATISEYRGQVGAMILRRWNFPEDMIAVALEAENWGRTHDGDGDYADLIIVAQLKSALESGGRLPAPTQVPAYGKLNLAALFGADGMTVLDEAREEIAEVQRFLIG
jgi:HD-like signal output (HDOD) protein